MTAAAVHSLPHPLTVGVEQIETALTSMTTTGWDGLDELAVKDLATRLMRIESRLRAHQAAATRVLDETGLAKRSGASSTGALLAKDFGGDRYAGDRLVKTGQAMHAAPRVGQALADGNLSERQATTIAKATADIPEQHRDRVEEALIGDAQQLTVKDLERRALRASDVYKTKPEADADENAKLEAREQRAWANASFRMWDRHDGSWAGEFQIPEAQADVLRTTLQALTAPRRSNGDDAVPTETPNVTRLGQAFARLAEKATAETIIDAGPTLLVTVDHETLAGTLAPATLETGTRLSAGDARRMACSANLLPGVMNGASVLLDHGRARRLFTPAQKRALAQRNGGCAFPGWTQPLAERSEARRQAAACCGEERTAGTVRYEPCAPHHVVHHQRWRLRTADDGVIEFQPPGTTGWQRNHRFRP